MIKISTLACAILMVSSIALADDTTTETCANGAGTIVIGAVSGHRYCRSTNTMEWWNAYAWCDSMKTRLFDLSDCACGTTTADYVNKCPEMTKVDTTTWSWTKVPFGADNAYVVNLKTGETRGNYYQRKGAWDFSSRALCY